MTYIKQSNMAQVKSEHKNKVGLALRFALEGIHRESTANTPMKSGQLRSDVKKSVTGNRGKIVWGKRYAAAQDAGQMTVKKTRTFKTSDGKWLTLKPGVYKFKNYTTPGTGKGFAENAAKKEGGNPRKYLRMAGLL
jgi:minor capsid protein